MHVRKALALLSVAALAAACGGASAANHPGASTTQLRLGYLPNVTQAGAVYGVASGVFAKDLGSTTLTTETFNAGPDAVEALFAGALDAAYLGPGPAVNAFLKSHGDVVIVAGATSGGAELVVRPGVTDLRGKTIADPQTGGTQDIALRTYLAAHGLHVDKQGGGDATIVAQDNATTLAQFKSHAIDGAWLPEPWASRLVLDGHGTVLVDERTLWPGGQFVTANLVVRKAYLQAHPDAVKALITGQVEADKDLTADPTAAQAVVNTALKTLTGKKLSTAVLTRAFANITLLEDPLAATLATEAQHAFATGLIKQGSLNGIYDLTLLRQVLGKDVSDAGLGGTTG
jgi:NitT/TauT family transport system substrate-binding protein